MTEWFVNVLLLQVFIILSRVLGDQAGGSPASSSSGGTVGVAIDVKNILAQLGSALGGLSESSKSFSTSSSSSMTVNNIGNKIIVNNIKTGSSTATQNNQTTASSNKTISHQVTHGKISISSSSSTTKGDGPMMDSFVPNSLPTSGGRGSSSSSSSSSSFTVFGGSLVVQVETTDSNKMTCTSSNSKENNAILTNMNGNYNSNSNNLLHQDIV